MQKLWTNKVLAKIDNQNLTTLRINAVEVNKWQNLLGTGQTDHLRKRLRRLELEYLRWCGDHPSKLLVDLENTAFPRLEELDIKARSIKPADPDEFDSAAAQFPPSFGVMLLPSLKSVTLHDVFGLHSQDLARLFRSCQNTLVHCKLWWVTLLEGTWHDVFKQLASCWSLRTLSIGRLQSVIHWMNYREDDIGTAILPAALWNFSQLRSLKFAHIIVEPANLARLILSCKDSLQGCELVAINDGIRQFDEVWQVLMECGLVRRCALRCLFDHSAHAVRPTHARSKKETLGFLADYATKWDLGRIMVDYKDLRNGNNGEVEYCEGETTILPCYSGDPDPDNDEHWHD